jgi:hypothetical protein
MKTGKGLHPSRQRLATIPYPRQLERLTKEELLERLRCTTCGARAVDLRRGWTTRETAPGEVVELRPGRR